VSARAEPTSVAGAAEQETAEPDADAGEAEGEADDEGDDEGETDDGPAVWADGEPLELDPPQPASNGNASAARVRGGTRRATRIRSLPA
jgi:hypothetical protein